MNKYKEKSPFIGQVSSRHEPPEPPTSRKPTPEEALQLKITLPWTDKVQVMTPDDLTPILFGKLEEYGLYRQEIKQLFGFKHDAKFYEWIHKNDIANGGRIGPRGRQPHREQRVATKPGQTQQQAINAAARLDPDPDQDKDLDAELAQVDQQLAAMGYGDGKPAEPAGQVSDDVKGADIVFVNSEPLGPKIPIAITPEGQRQLDAERAAEATREQVEEFFNDADPARIEVGPDRDILVQIVGDLSPQEVLEKLREHFPATGGVVGPSSGLATDQHHYNAAGDFQPIEVMQASMPQQQFIGFLRGNVIKYTMRAGRKDDMRREIDKVIQYATWWRQAVDGKTIDPREVAK